MQTLTVDQSGTTLLAASVLTIGNFDGVHRGHADIFAHLQKTAAARKCPSVVVTFEPHPLKLLAPHAAPPLITTFEQKERLIAQFGIDYLAVIPFTRELSCYPAEQFVTTLLCGVLAMQHIIIGHDYAFGRNREGNYETLQNLGEQHGFSLEDLSPVGENGVIFSSSLVRSAVSCGEMEQAAQVLGRAFQISGIVVHGREIGQTLGFPTANVKSSNELLPADGVYAVLVDVNGRMVQGACNIGCNPTVQGKERTIEVFLLDFSEQIYDVPVAVHFIKRLRPVQKFSGLEELKIAIRHDVAETRLVLEKYISGCAVLGSGMVSRA